MTVMVTGASGLIGRAAIPALLVRNLEVRAAIRRPEIADQLRSMGAKVTVGRLDDAGSLAAVCSGAYTLVHLVGGANQRDRDEVFAANHGSVLTAISAAKLAGVRRFVLLSSPGASPDAAHAYLRARGLAEEAVRESGLEHAIVRATHPYGVGGLWFTVLVQSAAAGFVIGEGTDPLAPIYAADVAEVLAAIDDRREEVSGTWALEGPDTATGLDLFGALAQDQPPAHLDPDEASPLLGRMLGVPVSADALRIFGAPCRADAPDASAAFGIARTPLAEGLRRTMQRAAAGLGG
jgi:NADH dehydrogenase